MDALRKAEQQKQKLATQGQGQADSAESQQGLELEPISVQATPERPNEISFEPAGTSPPPESAIPPQANGSGEKRSRLPDLPTRLEDLDEQFMAHAAQPPLKKPAAIPAAPPPPPPPAAPVRGKKLENSPESARKLLDAKLPPQPKNNRNFAIAVSLVTLVAGVGIGGYLWWEMQPKAGLMAVNAPPTPPLPAKPATPPPPVAVIAVAPPVVVAPPPAPLAAATPSPANTAVSDAKPAAPDDEDEVQPPPPPKPQRAPAATTAPRPDGPVRVSSNPKKTDPALEQAYQAFNSGDPELARANWKKVLANDPRNADALHGMAALALQANQPGQVAEFYLRALETDPKDALALSGLLALKAPADVMQAESRIKTLLAEQPDSPHLNFALGNLYARGTRWAEAQQSYFRAHTSDPGNPDYLFNLAVSLDQLHQPPLAAKYYGLAIEAAARQPAGFDAHQAANRLKALQSSQ